MQLGVYDLQRNYDTAPAWVNARRWWQTGKGQFPLTPYDVESFEGLGFAQLIPALAAGLTSVVAAVAPLYLAREQRKITTAQINADASRAAQAQAAAASAMPPSAFAQRAASNWQGWALPVGVGAVVVIALMRGRKRRR